MPLSSSAWTDRQHLPHPAQCLQVPQNISISTAPRQRQQLGKDVCSLEKLPFPPEFGRGTGLIQLNFHQQNCLKLKEKQQEGQLKPGREGRRNALHTQSITATDTYCTTAINPSLFGHWWRQKPPQQPPKPLDKEHSSAGATCACSVSLTLAPCRAWAGTQSEPARIVQGLVPQGVFRAGFLLPDPMHSSCFPGGKGPGASSSLLPTAQQ